MKWKLPLSCLLLLAISSDRSFVDTAPTTSSASPQQGSPEIVPETLDANVRELESLKQSIGKTLEMMKSHSSVYHNVNGQTETHSDSISEVKENGKLVAGLGQHVDAQSPGADGQPAVGSVRIDVDIPAKNIHKSTVQRLLPDFQQQYSEKRGFAESQDAPAGQDGNALEKFAGTQYSPLDMAEYVFWTGDEKGVTLAIEEFLQAGLMTREEAISFLQEIKYNLDYLQSHYTQLGLNARDRSKENTENMATQIMKARQSMEQLQQLQQLQQVQQQQQQQQMARPELKNNFDINKLRYQPNKKSADLYDTPKESEMAKLMDQSSQQQDEDYDELLERLRVADFLYTEYSLEEVIYQLAKVMFTQSLTRGSSEAQQALQKFTTFLETEADQGHISRALEKKVLDVLIASLTDTLGEHPELQTVETYDQRNDERQNLLRQILQMIPKDKEMQDQRVGGIQLKDENRVPLAALGKYKTIR